MSLLPGAAAAYAQAPDKETTIILSFDGMRHDLTQQYIKDGMLPHFKKIQKNGVVAKNVTTVNPSLTAASHASIATGAKPEKTGFVSNEFHYPDTKLTETQDAFLANIDVPPLWREVRNQGKTTATIGFPGSNPKGKKEADYAIYYGQTWSESKLENLKFKKAENWTNTPESYSPAKSAELSIKVQKGKNEKLHLLALDATDNNKTDYTHFYLSEDQTIDESDVSFQANDWAAKDLKVKKGQSAGFWFKLKGVKPDLSSAKLYRTAITSGVIEGPGNFSEEIKNKFGFFPDQDDTPAFKKGWITRKEYEEISGRFVDWMNDVSLYVKDQYQPDLLMFYNPQIDHEEHEFLLTDPRQPGHKEGKSKEYMSYVKWAYKKADETTGQTLKAMDSNDRLMIVSDHGMEPVHSSISPNYELKKAGLLVLDKEGKVDISKSKAYAVSSGSMAHVYINKKGREKGGIVTEKEYEQVQEEIVEVFTKIKDERKLSSRKKLLNLHYDTFKTDLDTNGWSMDSVKELLASSYAVVTDKKENPYEQILKSDSKKLKNSNHTNTGDVVLSAAEGYIVDNHVGSPIRPSVALGSHGGNPERKTLQPVFFAYGDQIEKKKIKRDISVLDIAPTAYKWMELETPNFVDGKPIKELVKK
nr:alkaline phosphatase family protein [Bacillus ectoiniformans]